MWPAIRKFAGHRQVLSPETSGSQVIRPGLFWYKEWRRQIDAVLILDPLDGIPDSVRSGRIGFVGFFALCLAGAIAYVLAQRPDQYCFAPPVHNWAFQLIRVCLLVELCGAVTGVVGMFFDKKRLFAVLAPGLFLPILIVDGLAMGCN